MATPRQTISVGEAARRLRVSPGTVRNWIRDGKVAATRGDQPIRHRHRVWVDGDGCVLGPDGGRLPFVMADGGQTPQLDDLQRQVDDLRQQVRATARRETQGEAFRDAALQLNAAMDRQRRALDLQAQAFTELNRALADQAAVISGLLVGDPLESIEDRQR